MAEDRRHPVNRRQLLPRTGGRRATDPQPATAAICAELRLWADAAGRQAQTRTQALCLVAAARLEELEAVKLLARTRQRLGGEARANALTPAQRSDIARLAVSARRDRR
jgi:hypothetical protein